MKNFRVLIADDMSTVRSIVKCGLIKNFPSIEIDEVINGKYAMEKLQSTHYDFIISDWEMPDVTGDKLLEWVRNHPKLKATPFLMMTAKNEAESIKSAIQKGVNAYLVKPFTMDALVQKVAVFMDKFDRRESERFAAAGNIILNFRSLNCRGNLQDISMGGLLSGVFLKKDPLPNILEKVQVDLEIENKHKVAGIGGFIIRIQAEEPSIDAEHIKIAIKFMDDLASEKKIELEKIVSLIQSAAELKFEKGECE
ncbi:MAG: response regulator [Deltaproteobacteria bacterium]|nr:response regulator [Deltaproteobacteria bacterium]